MYIHTFSILLFKIFIWIRGAVFNSYWPSSLTTLAFMRFWWRTLRSAAHRFTLRSAAHRFTARNLQIAFFSNLQKSQFPLAWPFRHAPPPPSRWNSHMFIHIIVHRRGTWNTEQLFHDPRNPHILLGEGTWLILEAVGSLDGVLGLLASFLSAKTHAVYRDLQHPSH